MSGPLVLRFQFKNLYSTKGIFDILILGKVRRRSKTFDGRKKPNTGVVRLEMKELVLKEKKRGVLSKTSEHTPMFVNVNPGWNH